jgi:hypothetical protein
VPIALDSPAVELAAGVVEAWRAALLKLARLPRGLNPKEYTPADLMAAIIRQERPAVAELWEIFNKDRGALTRQLLSGKREAVAYLLGFHLANAARAQLAFERAAERTGLERWLAGGPHLIWHDLGAGTGAAAQAFTGWARQCGLPKERLTIHLHDAVGSLLDAARVLFAEAGLDAQMKTHKVPLEKIDLKRFGPAPAGGAVGYSLGYVWNELAKNASARRRLIDLFKMHARRGDDGLLLVLEPATQAQSRAAMELRDQITAAGWTPLYPCPAATPCPMLRTAKDWCFAEGDWRRPVEMVHLDSDLGMDRSRITGTVLLFATKALAARLAQLKPSPRFPGVVVGRPARVGPQPGRGPRFDYLACATDGLKKLPPKPGRPALPRGAVASV